MTVADTVAPLVRATLGEHVPIKIACWDGSRARPSTAPDQLGHEAQTVPTSMRQRLHSVECQIDFEKCQLY